MLTTEGTNGAITAGAVGAGSTDGGTPPAANAGAAGGVNWEQMVKGLPDDLRNDANLTPIKSFESLAKSFISAQKMVGSKVSLPDPKHATQNDYVQLFRKMGAAEKLEDFKFKLPDGVTEDKLNPDVMGKLKEAAVNAGVLPWQFESIFGAYYSAIDGQVKANDAAIDQQTQSDVDSLKKEWGAAFDTQIRKANVVFKELVPEQVDRERLVSDGLGTHPVVMKLLLNASKFMKEDVFLGQGAGEFSGHTPEAALARAREIQGNKDHAYRNPTHPNHAAAKKEVADLYKVAFPE
jgi:hypothetical protein